MITKEKILEEVEKTLHSIDNIQNIEPNPFLFTRIKARIESDLITPAKIIKPMLILKKVALVLLLSANLFTVIIFLNKINNSDSGSESVINTLIEKYYYDYINY